jgi:hypothetical protein
MKLTKGYSIYKCRVYVDRILKNRGRWVEN